MNDFTIYVLTALALVFVIEGLIYALFPKAVQRMMAFAVQSAPAKLRNFGLIMAALGAFFVWLLTKI